MPWQWVKKKPKPQPVDTRCRAYVRFMHFSNTTAGITEGTRFCQRLQGHDDVHLTTCPNGDPFYFSDAHIP